MKQSSESARYDKQFQKTLKIWIIVLMMITALHLIPCKLNTYMIKTVIGYTLNIEVIYIL